MLNSMLINLTAIFLAVSVLLYCLFAGADFGGGMLESFLGKSRRAEQKDLIVHALAPVWEANHVWIILAVVILFNGFPRAFAEISTLFHIPLLIMLVGIILRGCAFTFRSYDVVKDQTQKFETVIFVFSSYLTPFMLGTIAGGLFLGRAPAQVGTFYETFVDPWCNCFSFSLGIFVCALFAFLAAVYLIGESPDAELQHVFSVKARAANAITVLCGGLVFLGAELSGFPLLKLFFNHPVTITCLTLATLILIPLWITLRKNKVWLPRALAAAQILLVMAGWFAIQFPAILVRADHSLTLYNSAAPELVLHYLLYALATGLILIFPALFYLMRIFKQRG